MTDPITPTRTPGDARSAAIGWRVAVAVVVGIGAAVVSTTMRHAITVDGVPVGDVGPPLIGLRLALSGSNPYALELATAPLAQYPVTTMVVLAPLLLVPLAWVAPLFCGLSTAVFAWALTTDGAWWRLAALLSVPYLMALYSVQWSPLLTTALVVPALLPLAVVKPQLGIALAAAGRWSWRTVAAAAGIVGVSLLVRPRWPLEWLDSGTPGLYDARIPLLVAPGFLLAASVAFVRSRRGRLVVAMALVPQRFWYDQLLLLFVPTTWRQMMVLLVTTWLGASWCLETGIWNPRSGTQVPEVWTVVVLTTHLPAVGVVAWQWWCGRRRAGDDHSAA